MHGGDFYIDIKANSETEHKFYQIHLGFDPDVFLCVNLSRPILLVVGNKTSLPSCEEWLCQHASILTRGTVQSPHLLSCSQMRHKRSVFSSGTFWRRSPLRAPVVQQPVSWLSSQCIPPCNKLLVQVSALWASSWPVCSRDPHKEALYEADSQAPWEEARPHFESDIHAVPRQQGSHLYFSRKIAFHLRCVGVGDEAHPTSLQVNRWFNVNSSSFVLFWSYSLWGRDHFCFFKSGPV